VGAKIPARTPTAVLAFPASNLAASAANKNREEPLPAVFPSFQEEGKFSC
jgi:hypothetical protein